MTYFLLKKVGSQCNLFAGEYDSIKDCIEDAVRNEINLDYVDLRGVNLMNADLDEGMFNHARFDHANLTGANLSGTKLNGACFRNATLYNTCFCEAQLSGAQFFGASFGATDIDWADISKTCFDTLLALDLQFSDALLMQSALYYDRTGTICNLSHPPVVIKGLQNVVVLFDDHMKVGSVVLPYPSWMEMQENGMIANLGGDAAAFIRTYGAFLLTLARIRSEKWGATPEEKSKNIA